MGKKGGTFASYQNKYICLIAFGLEDGEWRMEMWMGMKMEAEVEMEMEMEDEDEDGDTTAPQHA